MATCSPIKSGPFEMIAKDSSEQKVATHFRSGVSESKIVMPPSSCRRLRPISAFVYQLTIVIIISILLALTGFVCTYKIQAEEECQSSSILCYECDSRYHPNCEDPFDLPSVSLTDQQQQKQQQLRLSAQANDNSLSTDGIIVASDNRQQQQPGNGTVFRKPKKFPDASICRGCCVKITSKTPEGDNYVMRTCTEKLRINYFMVDLVCMKESGSRGNMCFCETDYCNGTSLTTGLNFTIFSVLLLAVTIASNILVPSIITCKFSCRL